MSTSTASRRVVFRCDAGKATGAGHVVRVVALIEQARSRGWDAIVCGAVENDFAASLLRSRDVAVIPAPRSVEELAARVAADGADVLHVDNYASFDGLGDACTAAGVLLSSMEDGPWGRRPADLVIDATPGAELTHRPDDGTRRLLRGAPAIPLRAGITALPPHRVRSAPDSAEIMVILGGTDAANLAETLTGWWLATGIPSTVHVVGRGPLDVRPGSGQHVVRHEPSESVPALFPTMDLVISGAGTTVWELAALGVPAALVQVVDNQELNFAFAARAGFARGLNLSDPQGSVEMLRDLVSDPGARRSMSEAGRAVVDGRGVHRVLDLWEEMLATPTDAITARPATIDDAGRLYDWRNEPDVRESSRKTEPLVWEHHIAWLQATLASPARHLLIAQSGRQPIGTVRFDREAVGHQEGETWEVSITLAPVARGRRLAGPVLEAAEAAVLAGPAADATTFSAEALESNPASWRLFLAAGYTRVTAAAPGWVRLEKSR